MPRISVARRGFLTIVGASGLAQVVGLLGMPVISRFFAPSEFGSFAVVNAAVLPAAALASLRLEMAVPLPEEERRAQAVAAAGLQAAATFGAGGAVLAAAAAFAVPNLWPGSVWLLPWIPVIAGLMGAFAVLNQTAVRYRAYSAIAQRNVLMAVSVVALQVVAGVLNWGAQGLAAGLAFGQMVGVLSLWRNLTPHFPTPPIRRSERREAWRVFRRFPLVLAPAGVVNVLGLSAPILLTASLYGAQVSGLLGMTQRVLTVPVALIGTALAQVYLGEFSRAKREASSDLARLFLRTSARLAAVALVISIIVFVASSRVFPLVLGEQWARSGEYAMALALGMGAQLCASPLSQTVIVMGRPGAQASWDVSRLVLCAGSVLVAKARGWDDLGAVTLLGAMMTISYAAGWTLSWWAVKHPPAPLVHGGRRLG